MHLGFAYGVCKRTIGNGVCRFFRGFCLGFHHLVPRGAGPKLFLVLRRCAVSQALVETFLVPPMHPLKRRDFLLDSIIPFSVMDQLIFVGAIPVFRWNIVIGVSDSYGRSDNPVLGAWIRNICYSQLGRSPGFRFAEFTRGDEPTVTVGV